MNPITITQLVHDRTVELQRTADGLRQERVLRPVPPARQAASGSSPATRPVELRRAPANAGGCSPAEPAV